MKANTKAFDENVSSAIFFFAFHIFIALRSHSRVFMYAYGNTVYSLCLWTHQITFKSGKYFLKVNKYVMPIDTVPTL
jgi:hypothetical protein